MSRVRIGKKKFFYRISGDNLEGVVDSPMIEKA